MPANMAVLALLVVLIPALALAYAMAAEPYCPIFKRHHLNLPATWPHGFEVLHISDLHVRRTDMRLLRAQRKALEGLAPDVVCVTGDVCEKAEDIPLLIELLRSARPRLG